jgi:NADH dehydrogenase [ubiquinone] 1 alpha subcomplex assembly factor 2
MKEDVEDVVGRLGRLTSAGAGGSKAGSYHVPTPPSPGVSLPNETVDPSRHSSPEELRKLSEEDTKRRIRETGVSETSPGEGKKESGTGGGGVGVGLGAGLKPRRRGGA